MIIIKLTRMKRKELVVVSVFISLLAIIGIIFFSVNYASSKLQFSASQTGITANYAAQSGLFSNMNSYGYLSSTTSFAYFDFNYAGNCASQGNCFSIEIKDSGTSYFHQAFIRGHDSPIVTWNPYNNDLGTNTYIQNAMLCNKTWDWQILDITTGLRSATSTITFYCPTSSFQNWKGEYYNNQSLGGNPIMIRSENAIDFSYGSGSPLNRVIMSDGFSARWTKSQYFTSGYYRFSLLLDDVMSMWVDNNLVVSGTGSSYIVSSNPVYLSSGNHSLKVEYTERTGNARARMTYESVSSVNINVQQGTNVSSLNLSNVTIDIEDKRT